MKIERSPLYLENKKFKCLVTNPCEGCHWYDEYEYPVHWSGDVKHIGWCKRFKPDPDAGYITEGKIPPCAVWGYEAASSGMQLRQEMRE